MIGSIESAMGNIVAMNNVSNVVFVLDGEMLNAYEFATSYSEVKVAHKNCSPIIGRATSSEEYGSYLATNNYGTWQENYSKVVGSTSILFDLSGENDEGDFILFQLMDAHYKAMEFDLENVWTYDAQTGTISLKNIIHA